MIDTYYRAISSTKFLRFFVHPAWLLVCFFNLFCDWFQADWVGLAMAVLGIMNILGYQVWLRRELRRFTARGGK